MSSPKKHLLTAAAMLLMAGSAVAHSPYLLPNHFDVGERDHVSVQASFTEKFFIPDVAMKSAGYHVTQPDGHDVALVPVYTKDLGVLDVDTVQPGSYRISSGIREGRTAKATIANGEWKFLREGDVATAGGLVYDVKSITRAEVYVSRGTPTDAVLAPRNKGLEFQMLTHPNKLLAGGEPRFKVLYDGRPLAKHQVSLQRALSDNGDAPVAVTAMSAVDGAFSLRIVDAGIYHAMLRYRFVIPGTDARAESHTYALTLEVTE